MQTLKILNLFRILPAPYLCEIASHVKNAIAAIIIVLNIIIVISTETHVMYAVQAFISEVNIGGVAVSGR